MTSRARPCRPRILFIALALSALLASPVSASPQTLKRSVGNILMAPLDVLCAPVVGTNSAVTNVRNIDDTTAVRVVYFLPGIAWNTMINMGAGVIREFTGLLEFLPGVGLLFFEADLDPLFAPSDRGNALVDWDTPVLHFKFGVDYTTQPF